MDHVRSEVEPSLLRGQWIISDRYTLSSLIYQSVTAPDPELAFPWVTELNRNARRPDLIVVLDVPKEVAEQRRATRGGPEELFDRRELQGETCRCLRICGTLFSRCLGAHRRNGFDKSRRAADLVRSRATVFGRHNRLTTVEG